MVYGEILLPTTLIKNKNHIKQLEYLDVLSSDLFSGRKFASEGNIKSQNYIVATLKSLAIPAFNHQYRHTFNQEGIFQSKQGTNIIAQIPGTQPNKGIILLSAHYDHLGRKGNQVFNGADDNASGVAALLYYAQRLTKKPLRHSVILLFTDGEEVGLLGAKAFVSQQKDLLKSIKLNINIDMIAGSKTTKKLRFISNNLEEILIETHLLQFKNYQYSLKNNASVQLTKGFKNIRDSRYRRKTNWFMASDHGVFNKAGIPFIYFGVGTHKHYHSESDNFSNINTNFYLAASDSIFDQLTYLDKAIICECTC